MGLLDRLKTIGKGLVDIVSAPLGVPIDLIRAIPDPNMSFGDPFTQNAAQFLQGVGEISEGTGFGSLARGAGSATPIDEFLGRVLSEMELTYNQEYQQELGRSFLGGGVAGFEPGQVSIARVAGAATGAIGAALPGGEPIARGVGSAWDRAGETSPGRMFVDSAFGVWDMPPLQAASFRRSPWYTMSTGTMDAVSRWYLDPIVMGGKGISRVKAHFNPSIETRIAKASKELRKKGVDISALPTEEGGGVFHMQLEGAPGDEVMTVMRTSSYEQAASEGILRVPGNADAVQAAGKGHREWVAYFDDEFGTQFGSEWKGFGRTRAEIQADGQVVLQRMYDALGEDEVLRITDALETAMEESWNSVILRERRTEVTQGIRKYLEFAETADEADAVLHELRGSMEFGVMDPEIPPGAVFEEGVTQQAGGPEHEGLLAHGQPGESVGDRSIYLLMGDETDEAMRYAAALYERNPGDPPVIVHIKPDGLPVIYEDFLAPHAPDPRSGLPSDASLITKVDRIPPEHIISVDRLGPQDLDNGAIGSVLRKGSRTPEYLAPGGRVHERLYDPDRVPIEPHQVLPYETVSGEFDALTQLYNTEGESAVRQYMATKSQGSRLGPGNTLPEKLMGAKDVQKLINHIIGINSKNKGFAAIDSIVRTVFSNHEAGPVLASALSMAGEDYELVRWTLGSAMGIRMPETVLVPPLLRARMKGLVGDLDLLGSSPEVRQAVDALEKGVLFEQDINALDNLDQTNQFLTSRLGAEQNIAELAEFNRILEMQAPLGTVPKVTRGALLRETIRSSNFYQERSLNRVTRAVIERNPHTHIHLGDPRGDIQVARQMEIARPLGVTADESSRFRGEYAEALAKGDRPAQARVISQMERHLINKAGVRGGMTPEEIESLVRHAKTKVAEAQDVVRDGKFNANSGTWDVAFYDPMTAEHIKFSLPLIGAGSEWVPMIDARKLIRATRRLHAAKKTGGNAMVVEAMDAFYGLWKPSVLLRSGWPLRVVTDEQLRILSSTGSLLHHLMAIEAGEMPPWQFLTQSKSGAQLAASAFGAPPAAGTALGARIAKVQSRVAQKIGRVDPDYMRFLEEAGYEPMVSARATPGGLDDSIANQFNKVIGQQESGILDHMIQSMKGGGRAVGHNDPAFTDAWKGVLTEEIFTSPLGKILLEGTSESVPIGKPNLVTLHETFEGGVKRVLGDHITYLDDLSPSVLSEVSADLAIETRKLLNTLKTEGNLPSITETWSKEFTDLIEELLSPLRSEIERAGIASLRTESGGQLAWDPNVVDNIIMDIQNKIYEWHVSQLPETWNLTPSERAVARGVAWLENTPEGRAWAKDNRPWVVEDNEAWVRQIHEETANLTGSYNEDIVSAVLEGRVTNELLESFDESLMPATIHLESTSQAFGTSTIQKVFHDFMGTSFDLYGRLPTDTLSRQPLFRQLYADERVRLRNLHDSQGIPINDEVLEHINVQARRHAQVETNRLLYNLQDVSRFGSHMRHFLPFYAAWQEVIEVWARIARQNPEVVGKGILLWRAPNKAGLVQKNDDGDEFLVFNLSEKTDLGLTGWAQYLAEGGIKFSKTSFNMVTNSPLPSAGPLFQLGINSIIKNKPEIEESLRWLIPFGVQSDWKQVLLSPFARRLTAQLTGPESDKGYSRDWANYLLWRDHRYRTGQDSTPPTYDEVDEAAGKLFLIRILASVTLPASPILDSPMKMYQDIYQDLVSIHGSQEAQEIFLNEYGDEFFGVTLSRTVSKTGIPPTVEAHTARQQFDSLIDRYPDYGRLIIGEDSAMGAFSSGAFAWQLTNTVGIGPEAEIEREYRRFTIDPNTGKVEEIDRQLGWTKYIQAMDLIEIERKKRGLPNLRVKDATDLADLKRTITAKLQVEYPSWWIDFNQRDDLAWPERISALRAIASSPVMDDRPDLDGITKYLEVRSAILQQLNTRKQTGGSATLDAQANQDLLYLWEALVGKVLEDNIAFAPIYFRYLEGDPVKLGSDG